MLSELQDLARHRYEAIGENKAPSQKVIGWVCSYVPEEVIYAAGMYPVRVIGGQGEITEADAYLRVNMCSFVRSCFEEARQGRYDFLDGFVTLNTCDHIRRLYDVWHAYQGTSFTHIMALPHKVSPKALDYFAGEVARFKGSLEEAFGVEIAEESLREAIEVYNRTRSLLRKLYDLRKETCPRISGAEFVDVVLAGMSLPKGKYNLMLEELLRELEERPGIPAQGKVRVLLTGSELDDSEYVRVIEESGAMVVADDLCTGSKYFWNLVDGDGDPLRAIARRYLTRPECPRMRPATNRLRHVAEMVESHRVQGVIVEVLRFCNLHSEGSLALGEALGKAGIPVLSLTREYSLSGVGQIKNRVEAFSEGLLGEV